MNCFIEQNNIDKDKWDLVFVDSIDYYYNEASEAPIEDESSPNSPFIGKTPQECHQLLLKLLKDTESEIMTNYFAIMDKRQHKTTLSCSFAQRGILRMKSWNGRLSVLPSRLQLSH